MTVEHCVTFEMPVGPTLPPPSSVGLTTWPDWECSRLGLRFPKDSAP